MVLNTNARRTPKPTTKSPRPANIPGIMVLGVENPRSTLASVLKEDLAKMKDTKPNTKPMIAMAIDAVTSVGIAPRVLPALRPNTEVMPNPRANGTIRPKSYSYHA
jgi:hypothetical protein